MGLDPLEQGVYQHHTVDQSRFPLAPDALAGDSGGGDAGDGAGGGCGGGEMGWSQIQWLLRFSYGQTHISAVAGCCLWWCHHYYWTWNQTTQERVSKARRAKEWS